MIMNIRLLGNATSTIIGIYSWPLASLILDLALMIPWRIIDSCDLLVTLNPPSLGALIPPGQLLSQLQSSGLGSLQALVLQSISSSLFSGPPPPPGSPLATAPASDNRSLEILIIVAAAFALGKSGWPTMIEHR